MEERSIIRIALPESDGKTYSRPALLLKKIPPHGDWLMCVISGKLHNETKGLDLIIDSTHPDFAGSHLKYPALIRTGILFTLPEERIEGKIGSISESTFNTILKNLTKFISGKQ